MKQYCVEDDEGNYVRVIDAKKSNFATSDVLTEDFSMTEDEAQKTKSFGDYIGSMFTIRKIGDVR